MVGTDRDAARAKQPVNHALAALSARLEWQAPLFAAEPERAALLKLRAPWPLTPRRIRFHRNHAIENALSVLRPFLEYAGIEPELLVGSYDDTLSFAVAGDADVEVIWLDYARFAERLAPAAAAAWLGQRLEALRARTAAPLLLLDWDGDDPVRTEVNARLREVIEPLAGVRLADRGELFEQLGPDYFDLERVSATGTRMSRRGAIHTARLLGTRWLAALLQPRLKAVVIDLDNTLYAGVLGEDGAAGVVLTDGHRRLQRELLDLRDSGLFLGLLSRNDAADVRELFARRGDFPVRLDDFSARSISWELKSQGLERIAQALRIDPAAMLFVDDNVGELLETVQTFPALQCLHADEDAHATAEGLRHYPGLRSFATTGEDSLRIADLHANEQRQRIAATTSDFAAYHEQLRVVLTIGHDRPEALTRAADLSLKTNQFNLALRRYGEPAMRAFAADGQACVSTARLQDRLTDSGIIAVGVFERRERMLSVRELCISCRALGRQLEDLVVAQMLITGTHLADVDEVVFAFRDGPRNEPAREWLERLTGRRLPRRGDELEVAVPVERVRERSVNPHVKVEVLP